MILYLSKELHWASEITQPAKGSCHQIHQPEFSLWQSHGGKEEPNPSSCPLTSTHMPWYTCAYMYTYPCMHTQINECSRKNHRFSNNKNFSFHHSRFDYGACLIFFLPPLTAIRADFIYFSLLSKFTPNFSLWFILKAYTSFTRILYAQNYQVSFFLWNPLHLPVISGQETVLLNYRVAW